MLGLGLELGLKLGQADGLKGGRSDLELAQDLEAERWSKWSVPRR